MENRLRPKPTLLALAACVVAIAGLGVWWLGPTAGEPVLAEVNGPGLSLERASQPLPATAGLRLQAGDVLRTLANATATIKFAPEQTSLIIQPGTELELTALSGGITLESN